MNTTSEQRAEPWPYLHELLAVMLERIDLLAVMWGDGKRKPLEVPRPEWRNRAHAAWKARQGATPGGRTTGNVTDMNAYRAAMGRLANTRYVKPS